MHVNLNYHQQEEQDNNKEDIHNEEEHEFIALNDTMEIENVAINDQVSIFTNRVYFECFILFFTLLFLLARIKTDKKA